MESIEIRFNRIVLSEDRGFDIVERDTAEQVVEALLSDDAESSLGRLGRVLRSERIARLKKLVFMSHKTGDKAAESEARYISRKHNVAVYMAEWDRRIINPSSLALPAYIMGAIHASRGFLVHVIAQIKDSMWIGYEVGGAHVFGKRRARITYNANPPSPSLPAVVGALPPLGDQAALDRWIQALP